MAKYKITITMTHIFHDVEEYEATVEAETEEAAKDIARDEAYRFKDPDSFEAEYESTEYDTTEIECIEGEKPTPCKLTIDMFGGLNE